MYILKDGNLYKSVYTIRYIHKIITGVKNGHIRRKNNVQEVQCADED